jgi:D-psicose/D-tagatose/L-ribulose 3-epimerase
MKFGTYFAYWEQEWNADYPYYCGKVAGLGFDILELGAGALADMSAAELAKIKSAAHDAGISLTGCVGLPAQYDVSSADKTTRDRGVDFLKKMLDALAAVEATVLGGIIYAYWPVDYSKPVDKPAARARSIESMLRIADYARDRGVLLVLETVNRFEQFLINTSEEAVGLVKDINHPNVKVMLDCFHMNIEEDFLGDAIRTAGKYLGHFHIGECNRKVPGKGHMPWDEMGRALRDIGYEGGVVMEPFVKTGGTVGSDIKVWRDLSENADGAKMDADIAEALRFVRSKFAGK